jgi:hypothetical protein
MTAPRPDRIDDILAGDLAPADEQTLRDALQPAEKEQLRRAEVALSLLAVHARSEQGEEPPANVRRRALDRLHAAGLTRSAESGGGTSSRPGWGRLLMLPLAAAAAAVIFLAVSGGPGSPPTQGSPMQVAWEDVRRGDPSLVSLPTSQQLGAMRALEDAGSETLLGPRQATPHVAPPFRWESVDDVESWIVTLYGKGEALETKKIAQTGGELVEAEYPFDVALERGASYSWSAVPDSTDPAAPVAVTFVVADAQDSRAYAALVKQINAVVPPDLQDLAHAYLALHGEYYGEAEQAALRYVERHPEDAGARELLRHLLRILGSSREAKYAP